MSSSTSHPPHSETKRVSKWVPIATFAGTTIALAIPLVLLVRQRKAALRISLQESSAPPPRRVGSTTVAHIGGDRGAVSSDFASIKAPSAEDSPRIGELVSAISKADLSSAAYAGKAFMIATGIVTVGALALSLSVKTVMGVKDTQDFAQRMRLAIWKHMPHLSARIRRPPETEDEGASFASPSEIDPHWNWEDAEKRLQAAYDNGGFPAWMHLALKEMEAELHVEKVNRQRELERQGKREART